MCSNAWKCLIGACSSNSGRRESRDLMNSAGSNGLAGAGRGDHENAVGCWSGHIRWEKKPENYLAVLHFICGLIAFRASGLLG